MGLARHTPTSWATASPDGRPGRGRVQVHGPGNLVEIAADAEADRLAVAIRGRDNRLIIAPGCELDGCRITIRGDGNTITVGEGSRLRRVAIRIDGPRDCGNFRGDRNTLTFGPSGSCHAASIDVVGSGNRLESGEDVHVTKRLDVHMHGYGNWVRIGAHTSIQRATLVANEIRSSLEVGVDCMLADDVTIATSDSHPILDCRTSDRVNPARDVVVGGHTWLGAGTRLLKGAEVGDGCVVGAGSIVTRRMALPSGELAHRALIAGIPATVRRSGITWMRETIFGASDDLAEFPDARAIDAFHHGHELGRRAECAARSGRTAEAVELLAGACQSYRDAVAAKPDYAYAFCAWGTALGRSGRLHEDMGDLLRARGSYDEALAQFDTAARLLPGYADAVRGTDMVRSSLQRLADAPADGQFGDPPRELSSCPISPADSVYIRVQP